MTHQHVNTPGTVPGVLRVWGLTTILGTGVLMVAQGFLAFAYPPSWNADWIGVASLGGGLLMLVQAPWWWCTHGRVPRRWWVSLGTGLGATTARAVFVLWRAAAHDLVWAQAINVALSYFALAVTLLCLWLLLVIPLPHFGDGR